MRCLALSVVIITVCASAATVPMYKIAGYSSAPFSATVADINEDGGNDVVVLAKDDGVDKVFWFENKLIVDAYGRFWEGHHIYDVGSQNFLYAADLDGSNFLDVVHSKGAGYINGGSAEDWTTFSVDAGADITVVGTADFDRDGDDDVLCLDGWYENSGSGKSWTAHTGIFEYKAVTPLDAENDGDWDALTIYEMQFQPRRFYIAENVDGTGTSWNEYEIAVIEADKLFASRGIAIIDADGNNTADVCVAGNAETAGEVLLLSLNAGSDVSVLDEGTAYSIVLGGDFDNDGLDEIVAYEYGEKAVQFFDNLSSSPNKVLIAEDFRPICAGDVNDDGADDLLGYSIPDNMFAWLDFQKTLYTDVVTPGHVPTETNTCGVYELFQSVPNPSYGDAVIAFSIPETTDVRLAVYDITGREIEVLEDGVLAAGEYAREVSELPAGVYVYRLAAGSDAAVKKMVVLE
jgi:hypothetical protein